MLLKINASVHVLASLAFFKIFPPHPQWTKVYTVHLLYFFLLVIPGPSPWDVISRDQIFLCNLNLSALINLHFINGIILLPSIHLTFCQWRDSSSFQKATLPELNVNFWFPEVYSSGTCIPAWLLTGKSTWGNTEMVSDLTCFTRWRSGLGG